HTDPLVGLHRPTSLLAPVLPRIVLALSLAERLATLPSLVDLHDLRRGVHLVRDQLVGSTREFRVAHLNATEVAASTTGLLSVGLTLLTGGRPVGLRGEEA